MLFQRSRSTESQQSTRSTSSSQGEKTRVYVTSLKSITSSSPSKINWSNRTTPVTPPPPARKALRRLVQWPRPSVSIDNASASDDGPIISDSISDSKRLQHSILLMTQNESMDEDEVHCCKQREAGDVVLKMQKRAELQFDEGKLHDALHNLNKSLTLQQKVYGRTHTRVAKTLNMMGEVLSNMGEEHRYMAMSALEESLAIRQELEPAGSEDTAGTLKNLWLLLHQSNVAISSVDNEDTISFHDFNDASSQVY